MSSSDLRMMQARIDAVRWYHEFDFPNGLAARSKNPEAPFHRALWKFIESQLDKIEFKDRSVLDLGCWDGYWSFYSERRGAKSVLASDDCTQNWAASSGLLLAKELFNSSVETKLDVSVYELGRLNQTFDIILCMGIYYHLVDPFYAFAQVRHCCHKDTIVVFEGDVSEGPLPNTYYLDMSPPFISTFVPTHKALDRILQATYFEVLSQAQLANYPPPPFKKRLRMARDAVLGKFERRCPVLNRSLRVCRPIECNNLIHDYRPPFGLHRYDDRFREEHAALAV